ncbi:MAG TPA: BMP family ABC transporter substrate-binding protein [Candidatus Dormibacteraeota bacterium]
MTDVSGLDSPVDADAWRGIQAALRHDACLRAEMLQPAQPAVYQQDLETLAGRDDLVIAGSFLLSDAVATVAPERPATRFLLVDPLVIPAGQSNLAIITFREDQAGFLAGALAAMVTRTRVVAGVYGLEGGAMSRYRHGFEQGAATVDASIRVLGAYQGSSDGPPFGNAGWGQAQARHFIGLDADIVFGAGGTTGLGALVAAADAGRFCIGAGSDAFLTGVAARPCLLSSAITRVDRAVETVVREAWQGRWQAGPRAFGVIEGGVGLAPFHEHESTVSAEIRARLETITQQLASGQLLDGN